MLKTTGAVLLVLVTLFQTACTSLKNRKTDLPDFNAAASPEGLRGHYNNLETDSFSRYASCLWEHLKYRNRRFTPTDSNGVIVIEPAGRKRIKASLLVNDSISQTVTLKGRFENGWFYVKRYYRIIPVPFVFFFVDHHRVRLGKLNNGQLVLDGFEHHFGWILFAGGRDESFTMKFAPVQK
jgi:hypothetical protein